MIIKIIKKKITKEELKKIAEQGFGTVIKAVVDVEKEIIALGGELHSDANELLIENGSRQENLWGINIQLDKPRNEWIDFQALINIRPSIGNRSMEIENPEIRNKIKETVNKLVDQNEFFA